MCYKLTHSYQLYIPLSRQYCYKLTHSYQLYIPLSRQYVLQINSLLSTVYTTQSSICVIN